MPLSNYEDWKSCSQTEGNMAQKMWNNTTGAAQSDTHPGSVIATHAEQQGGWGPGGKGPLRQHLEALSQNSNNSKRWQSDQMNFKI